MSSITSQDARRYLQRWALVEERELAELRKTSIETKSRQLAALMASRDLFRKDHDRDKGVREVRERWDRIRKALGD
jgi:hypothetical protein